jgi:hypothetical protein
MDATLARVCQDFEAVVLRPMFESLAPAARLFAGEDDTGGDDETSVDSASATIGALFSDALAVAFARAGGIGLGRALARSLDARAQ